MQEDLEFEDSRRLHELFGSHDENIRALERNLDVEISLTAGGAVVVGDEQELGLASRVLRELYSFAREGGSISPADVDRAVDLLSGDPHATLSKLLRSAVLTSAKGKEIAPKTANQRAYVEAMQRHDVVFGIGPAGTGKTYLAMAQACAELQRGTCDRIILTRPAVEAGERLGFLPGDLAEKVNPYLRPLYDALHEMVGAEKTEMMIERGIIEVAPLAFMRGRTLNRAFVILDEAQNTSREQMKMFLTRIGFDAKAVITGDITQVDLPNSQVSGLRDARRVLGSIQDIGFIEFQEIDVIRHPLVKRIIEAYSVVEEQAWAEHEAAASRATPAKEAGTVGGKEAGKKAGKKADKGSGAG